MPSSAPRTSRRAVLAAVGGTLAASTTAGARGLRSQGGDRATARTATLRVVCYPQASLGWSAPTLAARDAVRTGLRQVRDHAAGTDGPVRVAVDRGPVVPNRALDTSTQDALLASFRAWLAAERDPAGPTCHLLCTDAPLNTTLGYGGVDGHVTGGDAPGAAGHVNVGATEAWDGRRFTENMAVHEALHTFLTPWDAAAVNDSRCEHDLGAVVAESPTRLLVTPMASSYADDTGVGGESRFHGSGCYDHASFARHEQQVADDEATWYHTWVLSRATRQAVARYVDRRLRE